MQTLTALLEVRYAGKTIKPGESFEASEKDARILKATGKAADDGSVTSPVDLPAEAMAPAKALSADAETDADPKPEGGRGRYQRRDMRAEDGRTGADASSRSSRRDRRQSEPGSSSSEDDASS